MIDSSMTLYILVMYALRGNTGLGIHIVGLTDAAGLGIHIVGLTDAAGVCNTRNMLSTILPVLEVLQLESTVNYCITVFKLIVFLSLYY